MKLWILPMRSVVFPSGENQCPENPKETGEIKDRTGVKVLGTGLSSAFLLKTTEEGAETGGIYQAAVKHPCQPGVFLFDLILGFKESLQNNLI